MTIYYIRETALDFWRWKAATLSSIEQPKPVRQLALSRAPVPASQARAGCSHFRNASSPISVAVGDKRLAHAAEGIEHVLCTHELPPHAFCRLGRGIFVASPEYAFVTLAHRLDPLELVLLGCELTGTYVMRPDDPTGFAKAEPLASIGSLSRMAANCAGHKGAKGAAAACKRIIEHAASPMEARIALMLTLPCRLGGYGLPKPRLNHRLELTREQSLVMKRGSITMDMAWPKCRFAIEYESTAWHHGNEKFIQDSIRRNDIRSLGYDVTTITLDEYKSTSSMDHIAMTTASKLGVRLRLDRIDRNRQSALRRAMWQAS